MPIGADARSQPWAGFHALRAFPPAPYTLREGSYSLLNSQCPTVPRGPACPGTLLRSGAPGKFLDPTDRSMHVISTQSGRTFQIPAALASLGLLLASCSDDGNTGSSEDLPGTSGMAIQSCVLGCNGPEQGPLSCALTEVFVNQDIWIEFTSPVDLSTVTSSTFQVVESATGITPAGTYLIDPNNNRRVMFRPSLTFDTSGNPSFGLNTPSFYQILVPGALDGSGGPFIQNLAGSPNQIRMDCTVGTGMGVFDPVPGAPIVSTFIDVRDETGAVIDTLPLASATDVPVNSSLRFEFNDLMNPATLVNPGTGLSDTLGVLLDLDGDPNGSADQVDLPGEFTLDLDVEAGTTTVEFIPIENLPSAGLNVDAPRLVVVEFPVQIADLGGNSIQNPGDRLFTTEFLPQDEETLTDNFDSDVAFDDLRTSVFIEPSAASVEPVFDGFVQVGQDDFTGRIVPGAGGGSGRLGDLFIQSGESLVISTGPDIPTVFGPGLTNGSVDEDGEPTSDPELIAAYHVRTIPLDDYVIQGVEPGTTNLEVFDGVFEFSSWQVEPGSQVSFVGENPPRVFVRGRAILSGIVASTGIDAPPHDGLIGFGGPGGSGAAGGGAGGAGGDRPDQADSELSAPPVFGAQLLLGYIHEEDAVVDTNGRPGFGRGGVAPAAFNDSGAGGGGVAWPAQFPGPELEDLGDYAPNPLTCTSRQAGAPGAGGSFSFPGEVGNYVPVLPLSLIHI